MRTLAVALVLALAGGCADDECPPQHSGGGEPCSTAGKSCMPDNEDSCTCDGNRWVCVPVDTGHYPTYDLAVPDLSMPHDLSPATD